MKIMLRIRVLRSKVSSNMFYESLLSLIHGLIPDLFQTSASNKIKELYMNFSIKRDNNNNNLIINIKVKVND